MHPCALPDAALLALCRVEPQRAGGPGGQHANKTESGVRLVHLSSGLQAESTNHREKPRNIAEALGTLRLRLAIHQRGGSDPAWLKPHVRGRKLMVGTASEGLPRVTAVVLDAFFGAQGALVGAAAVLGISTTQLAGFLTSHGEIRRSADALRATHGLGPLHVR